MKRKIIILSIIAIIIVLIVTKINNVNKFKKEYESLNDKKNASGQSYIKLQIANDNPIVYSNYEEIFKVLNDTGIIYFGSPKCLKCREIVPILLDAAEEVGIEKIYYLNNIKDRDIKAMKDGKVVTKKEGTNNYKKLLKKLGNKASIYESLNDNNLKRLYYPTVIAVKNGEIIEIITKSKGKNIRLTKEEKKELKDNYIKAMNKIIMCGSTSDIKC